MSKALVNRSLSDADESRAYSVEEVLTTRLPMGRATLYSLLNSGTLRSFTIGRRRYISARSLAEFIAQRETDSSK